MEVHAHTHTPRKKWTHYFWEFLMLFLAVFCGFLAEYQLEHKIEKDREKVYINNLYEDLKSDKVIYEEYAEKAAEFGNKIDSLFTLLKSSDRNSHLDKIYFFARTLTLGKVAQLYPNKRTFSQLKNSGLLRLIHNQEVADAVADYYLFLEAIEMQNLSLASRVTDYMSKIGAILDAEVLLKILKEEKPPISDNLKLLSEDPVMINQFLTSAQYLYGSQRSQSNRGQEALKKDSVLMELIQKEYHLK